MTYYSTIIGRISFIFIYIFWSAAVISKDQLKNKYYSQLNYHILVRIRAEHFQWDQGESGSVRYCETCFTLSDDRFRTDIWSKHMVARCPDLSVYAQGYSNFSNNCNRGMERIMELDLCDGRDNGEHSGVGFVEICNIVVL